MLQGIHVPILLISKGVQLASQTMKNGNTSFSEEQNFDSIKESNQALKHSFCKINDKCNGGQKLLFNSDIISKDFEDFMEVCITYKCKECAYVSSDKNEFHQHCFKHLFKENLNKHTSESTAYIYLCSNCNKAFNSVEETKVHMVEEHNLKNDMYESDAVPSEIKTINISIESQKEAAIKKEFNKKKRKLNESLDPGGNMILSYFCRKRNCKYKFRNEKDLGIHEMCHLDSELGNSTKRLYQCFKCNELFSGWHTCCSHLFKAHEIDCDLLQCPLCESYRTSLPLRLENHIRIHSDVRAFPCKYCGKTFKQASQLRNHVVIHIEKNGQQKPFWSRSKQCNICFKMYSDSKSLKKHKEEVHSKLRPFVCSICGHASARKAMLLMHQRQHTGQKPYICQLCSYKTADHNSLRKHMMRHTGVRPYKCSHCDYSAIQSGSFKNHMKIVHPSREGMFICNLCQYKTVSEDNYIRHVSDHLTGVIKCNAEGEEKIKNKMEGTNPSGFLNGTLFVEN